MKLEEEFNKIKSTIKKNKPVFLAILITILVIGGIFYFFTGRMMTPYRMAAEYAPPPYAPLEGVSYKTSYEREIEKKASELLSKPEEYKIKRGSASIKSMDAPSDYERIQHKAITLDGWVETMSKSEDYSRLSMTANLKIPFENFDSFADWLMHNFDVKSANFELYKITVERQQDEIEILLVALEVYDRLLERAEEMNVSESSIELIMKITQRKLDVMRLLRQYGYSIEEVERKAKYASLSITITQEKKIKIMPEGLGRELRARMRNSVRNITNTGMDLITKPIVLFVKIIVWIVYAIVVLIPVFIAYRILMRVLKWIGKKIK